MKYAHQQALSQLGINLPPVPAEFLTYQSFSEYACSKLLEKYTNWKGIQGITFQIAVGRTNFDFLVGNTLVEYHPISIKREFKSDGLSLILSAMHTLGREDKLKLLAGISAELQAQYDKRRKQVASAHPTYGTCDVICAFNEIDFIEKVLFRFAVRALPARSSLAVEFRTYQKHAANNKLIDY